MINNPIIKKILLVIILSIYIFEFTYSYLNKEYEEIFLKLPSNSFHTIALRIR
jgi:hypothetical protein